MKIFHDNAPAYYSKSLPVIPLLDGQKYPTIEGWSDYCESPVGRTQQGNWIHNSHRSSNIGLCLGPESGLIALDIDITDNDKLTQVIELLPYSPIGKIGKKGITLFYKYDGEVARKWHPIELLSTGNQTVLPPSIHPETQAPYRWTTKSTILNTDLEHLPTLGDVDIEAIVNKLFPPKPGTQTTKTSSSDGTRCNHGSHNKLSEILVACIHDNQSPDEIVTELLRNDDEINKQISYFTCPSRKEFRTKDRGYNCYQFVMQGLKNSLQKKKIEKININNVEMNLDNFIPKIAQPRVKRRKKLPKLKGLAQEIFQHIYNNSHVPRSNFAYASTLSIMSVLTANRVHFKGTHSNLYLLIVADSGTGKNIPIKTPSRILTDCDLGNLIGVSDVGSDNSFLMDLEEGPVRLSCIDEASKLFKATNSKELFLSRVGDLLSEIYSSPGYKFNGKRTAMAQAKGKANGSRGECFSPCVSILGAMTVSDVNATLTLSNVEKGLGGRFIYFTDDRYKDINVDHEVIPLTDSIIKKVKDLRNDLKPLTKGDLFNEAYNPVDLKTTDAAEKFRKGLIDKYNSKRKAAYGSKTSPLSNRYYENMIKMAIIHHCSDLPDPVWQMKKESFVYADKLMQICEDMGTDLIGTQVKESENGDAMNKICQVVLKNGGKIKRGELTYIIGKKLSPFIRKGAMADLLESGRLIESNEGKGNKKAVYFTLND